MQAVRVLLIIAAVLLPTVLIVAALWVLRR